jgi:hypothetical protein
MKNRVVVVVVLGLVWVSVWVSEWARCTLPPAAA